MQRLKGRAALHHRVVLPHGVVVSYFGRDGALRRPRLQRGRDVPATRKDW